MAFGLLCDAIQRFTRAAISQLGIKLIICKSCVYTRVGGNFSFLILVSAFFSVVFVSAEEIFVFRVGEAETLHSRDMGMKL